MNETSAAVDKGAIAAKVHATTLQLNLYESLARQYGETEEVLRQIARQRLCIDSITRACQKNDMTVARTLCDELDIGEQRLLVELQIFWIPRSSFFFEIVRERIRRLAAQVRLPSVLVDLVERGCAQP